jgi:hypothetical protein
MRNIGRGMEELADSVTAVGPDDTAVLLLGVLLNDVSKLSDQNTGLDGLDGLLQALAGSLDNTDGVGVGLGLLANVVGLVEIGMISSVVERNIEVQDITVQ